MPWISHSDYTQLIRENERAQSLAEDVERLRRALANEIERSREERVRYEARLDKEIARNQKREERLVDRVLTSKGTYAVVTAAEEKKAARAAPSHIPLTAIEEAQLKMYIESAAEHNYGPDVARRMFERDRRKKLEPEADLSAYNDLPVIKPPDEIRDDVGPEIEE